jgi:hypothetical protein
MNQTVRVNHPQVVCETIDGEVVIIHLETGCYYSLSKTGAAIWSCIERQLDPQALVQEIRQTYSGEPATVSGLVLEFLDLLKSEDLIVYSPVTLADLDSASVSPPADQPSFEKPVLEKFSDMEDLLLLDPIHEVDVEAGWPNEKSVA